MCYCIQMYRCEWSCYWSLRESSGKNRLRCEQDSILHRETQQIHNLKTQSNQNNWPPSSSPSYCHHHHINLTKCFPNTFHVFKQSNMTATLSVILLRTSIKIAVYLLCYYWTRRRINAPVHGCLERLDAYDIKSIWLFCLWFFFFAFSLFQSGF